MLIVSKINDQYLPITNQKNSYSLNYKIARIYLYPNEENTYRLKYKWPVFASTQTKEMLKDFNINDQYLPIHEPCLKYN